MKLRPAGSLVALASMSLLIGCFAPDPSDSGLESDTHELSKAKPVKPGKLASITVSPSTATIAPGGSQTYTVLGKDEAGISLGDVTGSTTFKIAPNGSCQSATCTAAALGPHTVTATHKKIVGTASLVVAAPQADLAVTETVDHATPLYYTSVTFTTTVTNTSSTQTSNGVTTTIPLPPGLVSPSANSSNYNLSTGVWTIGTLAPGASATLKITGHAGNVALGSQMVTATVASVTPDPNPANNHASASEAATPAPVAVTITPAPGNPPFIDISLPGSASWTASFANAANPAAPAPLGTSHWTCDTNSLVPCPVVGALVMPNVPTLSFEIQTLQIDIYHLTSSFMPADPNYQSTNVSNAISFTTTNSGS